MVVVSWEMAPSPHCLPLDPAFVGLCHAPKDDSLLDLWFAAHLDHLSPSCQQKAPLKVVSRGARALCEHRYWGLCPATS